MTISPNAKELLLLVCVLSLILAACDSTTVSPEEPASTFDQQEREEPAPLYLMTDTLTVPNNYIIVFKPDAPGVQREGVQGQAEQMMQGVAGSEIEFIYENILQGFSARIPEQALESIRNNPNVKHVEQVQSVPPDSGIQQSPPWQLDRVDQRDLPLKDQYRYFGTGLETEVWVLDTGLNYHEEFGNRVSTRMSLVDDGEGPGDCYVGGHGTQVASAAAGSEYGIAKEATISSIRIGECPGGSASSDRLIAALDHVKNFHEAPAVANLSYSFSESYSIFMATAELRNSGVLLVTSAGNNDSSACNSDPRIAMKVGAVTSSDTRSNFSNYGDCLALFAPGSWLTLASSTSETGSTTKSGTSFSSPMVAGAAALIFESNPGFSPSEVSESILNNATEDVLSDIGPGSPNRLLYAVNFDAYISGPTYINQPDTYTWTAHLKNEGSNTSYLWERKSGSTWETVGTSESYSESAILDGNNFSLRLTVISNDIEITDEQVVVVELDDGNECEPEQIIC